MKECRHGNGQSSTDYIWCKIYISFIRITTLSSWRIYGLHNGTITVTNYCYLNVTKLLLVTLKSSYLCNGATL